MAHPGVQISLGTRSGAQQWQRAALIMSMLAGALCGLFAYTILYHRQIIPVSQDTNTLGLSLSGRDAHSQLATELFGYTQNEMRGSHPSVPTLTLLDIATLSAKALPFERTTAITTLFPTSYLSYNGSIVPLRVNGSSIDFFTSFLSNKEYSDASNLPSVVQPRVPASLSGTFSGLALNALAFDGDNHIVARGTGDSEDFVRLTGSITRNITTGPVYLEDGTRITEMRSSGFTPSIETANGISTYTSANPFVLATYNGATSQWTLRNQPNSPQIDASIKDSIPNDCPNGSHGFIHIADTASFLGTNFVHTILDKININKRSINLCITVDKL